MVFLVLIVSVPLLVEAGRWAWRFQLKGLAVVEESNVKLAGERGVVANVELVTVLPREGAVLITFRPSGMILHPPWRVTEFPPPSTLLLSLDGPGESAVTLLDSWRARRRSVLLWRGTDDQVELTDVRTRRLLRGSVVG